LCSDLAFCCAQWCGASQHCTPQRVHHGALLLYRDGVHGGRQPLGLHQERSERYLLREHTTHARTTLRYDDSSTSPCRDCADLALAPEDRQRRGEGHGLLALHESAHHAPRLEDAQYYGRSRLFHTTNDTTNDTTPPSAYRFVNYVQLADISPQSKVVAKVIDFGVSSSALSAVGRKVDCPGTPPFHAICARAPFSLRVMRRVCRGW
jgi:hypothetical protein